MSNTPYFDEYEARRNLRSVTSTINQSVISSPIASDNVYYFQSPAAFSSGYYPSEYRLKKHLDDIGNLIDVELERNVNGNWEIVQA